MDKSKPKAPKIVDLMKDGAAVHFEVVDLDELREQPEGNSIGADIWPPKPANKGGKA